MTFNASDPRDLIYAFFGLVDPSYRIFPDYSPANSVTHVMIQAATSILAVETDLRLLNHATFPSGVYRNPALPTWVPNWFIENSRYSDKIPRYATGNEPPTIFDNDSEIQFVERVLSAPVVGIQLLGARLMLLTNCDRRMESPNRTLTVFCTNIEGYVAITNADSRAGDEL